MGKIKKIILCLIFFFLFFLFILLLDRIPDQAERIKGPVNGKPLTEQIK